MRLAHVLLGGPYAKVSPKMSEISIEFVELCVASIADYEHTLCSNFGFVKTGQYNSPQIGESVLLEQGRARLRITEPSPANDRQLQFLEKHGDGVCDVAFRISSFRQIDDAIRRGLIKWVKEPKDATDFGVVSVTSLPQSSLITHTLVPNQANLTKSFGFSKLPRRRDQVFQIRSIDHIAFCVSRGSLPYWVSTYTNAFGFHQDSNYKSIESEKKNVGMRAASISDKSCLTKLAFVEPLHFEVDSQLTEFLQRNDGGGVQHIAFETPDLLTLGEELLRNGFSFIRGSEAYYEKLENVHHNSIVDLSRLRVVGAVLEQEGKSYIIQAFTDSVVPRKTVFFEFVEHRGRIDFLGENAKALFEGAEMHRHCQRQELLPN